jgi:hypothetical protein
MPAKILHKIYGSEVLSHDDDALTLEHFISTEKQDVDGDIMRADGMQPRGKVVVLQQHGKDPRQGNEPIAKSLGIRPGMHPTSGNPGLIAKTQFYDGSHLNPPDHTGQKLYEKARDGFMPNWSIGWLPSDEKGANIPIKGGMDRKKWRLHEYSLVGVGANDEATCADEYKCKSLSDYHNVFTVRHEEAGVEFPECRVVLKGDKLTVQEKSFLDFFDEKDFLDNTEEVKFAIGAEMQCIDGRCELVGEGKPFPNEHSCRLVSPIDGAKTRRKNGAQKHNGKAYDVIYQEQKGKWMQQAYRYPKEHWTASEASAHCKSHKGSFTAAKALEKTNQLSDDEVTNQTVQARIAHKAMHIAHQAMMHRMKSDALKHAAKHKTEGGMADSLENMGNDALEEYRGLVEDHVEKYIKAAQANNANPEFDEDDAGIDDSTKDFVQASIKVHHDALKTVHKAMIHEIHKHKDKPSVNSRAAAKDLLDQHHKMALPHAVKYIQAHIDAAKCGKSFTKEIEDHVESRIACDSLRAIFDGMFTEAWMVAQDKEKDTVTEEELAGIILEEFEQLALPYLADFISIIRGPDNDGDDDTEEGIHGEPMEKKDFDALFTKKEHIEVSVDLNGMKKILTGIFEKALAQIPTGDRSKSRPQGSEKDDLYKKALEGVTFKIGQQ